MPPSDAVAPGDNLPKDDRSPIAIAAEWSSRIMSIALEMVLPGVAGMWLDRRLGTKFVFTLGGFGLGMFAALWHLTHLVGGSKATNDIPKTEAPGGEIPKTSDRNHP